MKTTKAQPGSQQQQRSSSAEPLRDYNLTTSIMKLPVKTPLPTYTATGDSEEGEEINFFPS